MSCGARVNATTTATPTSYSAAGTQRSNRVGVTSALAAPTQMMTAASRRPSYSAATVVSAVTGPPSRTPLDHPGSGSSGSVNSTVVPWVTPNSAPMTTRMTTMIRPSRRNTPYAPAHGVGERRATTT